MACNTCQSTKSIPVCTDSLVLGTITSNTDVYIFVVNHSSGYTHRQEATSGNYGELRIDLTKPDTSFYNPDSAYEIWATLQTSSQNERLDITIDAVEYTCFNLSFNRVFDELDANVNYTETTLEIDG